eukprot:15458267-Alexandrium_andersonii.AAC.1
MVVCLVATEREAHGFIAAANGITHAFQGRKRRVLLGLLTLQHTLPGWRSELEAGAVAPAGAIQDDEAADSTSAEGSDGSGSPARDVLLKDAWTFSVEEFRQRLEEVCSMHLLGDCQAPDGECPMVHASETELA